MVLHKNEEGIILEEQENIDIEYDMDMRYGPHTSNYDLRPRKPRDYSHLHATLDPSC